MPEKLLDVPRVIKALNAHDAQYVLVGGMALVVHGGSATTVDADLAVATDEINLRALCGALTTLNARPPRLAEGFSWLVKRSDLRRDWSVWNTDAGRINVLVRLPGIESFKSLSDHAQIISLGQEQCRVASLEDLLRMKRSSERPKDKLHVLQIEAVLREQSLNREVDPEPKI